MTLVSKKYRGEGVEGGGRGEQEMEELEEEEENGKVYLKTIPAQIQFLCTYQK